MGPILSREKFEAGMFSIKRWLRLQWHWAGGALYVTILPLILYGDVWFHVLLTGIPASWDGSGHYAIANIYQKSLFPDTFGRTDAYFCGMAFPNFYPPLLDWTIGFIAHLHLASFDTVFKCVTLLPLVLIPPVVFFATWILSDKQWRLSLFSALWCVLFLVEPRFAGSEFLATGTDYFSTIQVGIYAQPFGTLVFLIWLPLYSTTRRIGIRFVLSVLALAGMILSNVFIAIAAAFFIISYLCVDLIQLHPRMRLYFGAEVGRPSPHEKVWLFHLLVPACSLCVSAFWIVPVISTYKFFVTSSSP
jgi:hypothetical protein